MILFTKRKNFYIIFTYLVTLSVIALYAGWIYGLVSQGVLEGKDLVWSITNLLGWVVVLFVIIVHLKKTRKDARLEKQEELRKTLTIDAFKEINKMSFRFASVLDKVAYAFTRMPEKLKLHINEPASVKFNKPEVDREIDAHIKNLMDGYVDFVQSVQANEMAVIKFSYLKDFIKFKGEDVNKKVAEFQQYFATQAKKDLTTNDGYQKFGARCGEITEELSRVNGYLIDYRSEVMKETLGDVFESSTSRKKSGSWGKKEKVIS